MIRRPEASLSHRCGDDGRLRVINRNRLVASISVVAGIRGGPGNGGRPYRVRCIERQAIAADALNGNARTVVGGRGGARINDCGTQSRVVANS